MHNIEIIVSYRPNANGCLALHAGFTRAFYIYVSRQRRYWTRNAVYRISRVVIQTIE
jgi:hypothetical protein